LNWFYRISFYRRIQVALLLFLIIPLLLITGLSYFSNKQANEENVRAHMKGIIGILANDLSKTANDITYTANQYSASQSSGLFADLRELKDLSAFADFAAYRAYTDLNESAALHTGKLSLAQVKVFYVNRAAYPLIGSLRVDDAARLLEDARFGHLSAEDAATGIVRWFRAEREAGYGDVFGAPYYLFMKKTVYDPYRREVLGTLFVGIPSAYFDGLFRNAGDGVFTLYEADRKLLAGMAGSAETLIGEPRGGWMRERIGVPGTSWTLTYELELSSAIGDVTQRFWYLLMAVSIVLFVFLFISVVIAKGLNRPIHRLMRVAAQYGEGNSSVRYNITGQDEISLLGGSINQMLDNINALIRKVETEQEEKRTIELYALASQIQPHFLLNTLNSIKCNLALEGDRIHSESIDSLMAVLRAHLRLHEPHTLAEECKLLAQYVSIKRMRNRLDVELDMALPERLRGVLVPRLLLQPLIENSIIHGFKRSVRSPRIEVSAEESAGVLLIRVEDNGLGISDGASSELNRRLREGQVLPGERGVGLYNVMRRLKLTFGDRAEFLVGPGEREGFAVCLKIPWSDEERRGRVDDQSDADR